MTFDSDALPEMTRRSEIYREFNYSNRVIRIYDLQEERSKLLKKLNEVESEIETAKSELPKEVIDLYEQMRVVDKLRGPNE